MGVERSSSDGFENLAQSDKGKADMAGKGKDDILKGKDLGKDALLKGKGKDDLIKGKGDLGKDDLLKGKGGDLAKGKGEL